MSDSPDTNSTTGSSLIRAAAKRTVEATNDGTAQRKALLRIVGLNALVIVAAAVTLILTERGFRVQSETAARVESRFVTTEWSLLQEVQQRTDRAIREKDREISSLLELQTTLANSDGLAEEVDRVRQALNQAYAERETLLQARLSGSGDNTAVAVQQAEAAVRAAFPSDIDAPGTGSIPDGPVETEMLTQDDPATLAWYRRIIDQLRVGQADAAQQQLETTGQASALLGSVDYDRLFGLATLILRQETFLDSIRGLQREISLRDSDLAVRAGRIAALEEELAALEDEFTGLESSFAEEQRIGESLRKSLDASGSRIAELEADGAVSRELVAQLRRDASAQAEVFAAAQAELTLLQRAVSEAELAYAALVEQSRLELAEAVERATTETFASAELLLDYLAGVSLSDPSAARTRILAFRDEQERYSELITRARRLAESGIAQERDNLPATRLVGVITSVEPERVLVESLTEVAVLPGTRVEIRSREGVQPGELLAVGEVELVVGDLISAAIVGETRASSVRDLVYAVVEPTAP